MTEQSTELQVQETEKQEIVEEGAERMRERITFLPRVDIYETNTDIVLVADMPGVTAETIDITLEKSILTITGIVEPDPIQGYNLAYAEYRVGDYQRSFSISNEIDEEKIAATVKDGVLRLTLPKAVPTTRRIAVKAL
ncbi:MAG: Hsp20/alpha crystallin family protein [Anaerolineae bacterium]|nr:Hsp20/alpha crystallin family protein [Anaerolineae bacterium]